MTTKPIKTIPQAIHQHFLNYQHDTGISGAAFTATVREHYEKTYPEHSRLIEWSHVSDPAIRMQRDFDRFQTWLHPDSKTRFPLEMLESVIAAFPPDRRLRLQMELAERQGMMVFSRPSGKPSDTVLMGGRIAKECGEVLIALAAINPGSGVGKAKLMAMEDAAINEIDEAISALLTARSTIISKNSPDVCVFEIRLDEMGLS